MSLYMQNKEEIGVGVFTSSDIAANEMVCALTGIVRSSRDLSPDMFALQIGDNLWLTSTGGNIDDYINHSCSANTGFKNGSCVLYALRDIRAEEEITFDYSSAMNDSGWSMDCLCGEANCRKKILPYFKLSPEEKKTIAPHALEYLTGKTSK